jgi:hypothetical protein
MSASQFIEPLLKCARHSMLPNKFGNHNIVREECQQKVEPIHSYLMAINPAALKALDRLHTPVANPQSCRVHENGLALTTKSHQLEKLWPL